VTRRTGVAELIMLTTIVMAGGRSATAADWSNTLDAQATAAYVTNPRMVAGDNTADESAQVTLDGSTSAQTERGQFTVTPRFSVLRYAHETDLDVDTGGLDLAYTEKLERGQWTADLSGLSDSTVTSELGTTGVTYVNRRHNQGNLSLGYQYFATERLSWLLQGSGQITRYNDAEAFGLVNYDYGSVQFGPMWNFSERVVGSLFLEADRLNPQSGTRQNDYSVFAQLQRNFSEQYSWRASVGGTRTDYGSSSGSAGSQTTTRYELGANRQGERVQWDISIKRAVLPIGIGLLAPQTVASFVMTVGTSENSKLSLAANGIRTDSVSVGELEVYSGATWGQVSADWRYQFAAHWSVSAGYTQGRSRVYPSPDWANGNQARVNIAWNSGRL